MALNTGMVLVFLVILQVFQLVLIYIDKVLSNIIDFEKCA